MKSMRANRRQWILGMIAVAGVLSARPLHAVTPVVVGTCQASPNRFPTIQQALNAVSPSGTVLVCAGIYPEQVFIHQPVTLKGVPNGKNQEARIVAPFSGMVPDVTSGVLSTGSAHILVMNAGAVTLNNISIQGQGANPASCNANSNYYGIAIIGTNATVTNLAVRDIGDPQASCYAVGIAIEGQNNSLSISNSIIHDGNQGVLTQNAGTLTLASSTMADLNGGIQVAFPHGAATINGNSFLNIGCPSSCQLQSWMGLAVKVFVGATGGILQVTNNTIAMTSNSTAAIDLSTPYVMPATVTGNKITGGAIGIYADGATDAVIKSNTLQHVVVGLKINDYDRTGSNTLSSNTIKEAACGVWTANSTGDTVGPNTLVLNTMTTCP